MSIKLLTQLILSRVVRFFPQWRIYCFSVAFWCLNFPFYRIFGPFKYNFAAHKHRSILKYLSNRYEGLINRYAEIELLSESKIEPESTIWVCWWDGKEAMPDIVKSCYNSILCHANKHKVQLITKDNFHEYISIPDYILKKVNSGKMTVTHFSNILRANLLYDYGGIWLDATIFMLRDFTFDNMHFYTLKAPAGKSVSITLNRYAGLINKSVINKNHEHNQISRWSGFLFTGTKNSPFFQYMRDILYAYWKEHNDQIDYLLYDYTIALGYDSIPFIKKLIDNVPCSSTEKFVLENKLNTAYSEEYFEQFTKTNFHKLTWKKNFDVFTKDNKLTIYGYLTKQNNS
jgi:hypothetical protein